MRNHLNRYFLLLIFLILSCLTRVFAGQDLCYVKPNDTFDKLEACLTLNRLTPHLKVFQNAALSNQGDIPYTRFTGTKGDLLSRQYIIRQMKSAGYVVSLQEVVLEIGYIKSSTFKKISPSVENYIKDLDYTPYLSSGAGNIQGQMETPSGNLNGCQQNDFAGFKRGHIALLKRGGNCATRERILNAVEAGAAAVIISNDSEGVLYSTLGSPIPSEKTPVLMISQALGNAFLSDIQNGQPPVLSIQCELLKKTVKSQNIFAESKSGDPTHIIMAGAHLDSTAGNAGLNDNASAAASVLEVALLMQKLKFKNKIRFAWWTAEELGLLGSHYYIDHLSQKDRANIALYLNYEILGAPNGGRMIMGTEEGITSPGSEAITKLYADYFASKNLKYIIFNPKDSNAAIRSDMYPFMQANIPVGYLVTGAEIAWTSAYAQVFSDLKDRILSASMHPCYHKQCDVLTLDGDLTVDPNFDFDLYLQMTKAAAFAIYTYSM